MEKSANNRSDRYYRTVYCALNAIVLRFKDLIAISEPKELHKQAFENKKVVKLMAKMSRRMKRMERHVKSLKFSKAFGVLLTWAQGTSAFQECLASNKEMHREDTDSDGIQSEFEDYMPKPDRTTDFSNYCFVQ